MLLRSYERHRKRCRHSRWFMDIVLYEATDTLDLARLYERTGHVHPTLCTANEDLFSRNRLSTKRDPVRFSASFTFTRNRKGFHFLFVHRDEDAFVHHSAASLSSPLFIPSFFVHRYTPPSVYVFGSVPRQCCVCTRCFLRSPGGS